MGSLIWLVAAVALAGVEAAVGEFTFLMLAAGALTTSAAALAGLPVWAEVTIFAVSSAAFWFFLRPYLHRRLVTSAPYDDSPRALIGTRAVVLEPVTARGGQVRFDGGIWSARSFDPSVEIPVGSDVIVSEIDGPVVVVWKED
ncbi:NfeD family protein [Corynebacterium mayonis]|uniref:NfeD family protein n=1 Tax=Corynebacterium mayonis TaxID=3062461 RepID=UPI003140B859